MNAWPLIALKLALATYLWGATGLVLAAVTTLLFLSWVRRRRP